MTLSPLSFGIYLHLSHCHVTSLSPVLHVIVCVEFWSGLYFNPISVSLGVYMCVCVGCSQNNWLPVTCSMSCGGGQQHVFTPGFNIPLHTHTFFYSSFKFLPSNICIYQIHIFCCCWFLQHTNRHTLFCLWLCHNPYCVRFGDCRRGKWNSLALDYSGSQYQTVFEINV